MKINQFLTVVTKMNLKVNTKSAVWHNNNLTKQFSQAAVHIVTKSLKLEQSIDTWQTYRRNSNRMRDKRKIDSTRENS